MWWCKNYYLYYYKNDKFFDDLDMLGVFFVRGLIFVYVEKRKFGVFVDVNDLNYVMGIKGKKVLSLVDLEVL